jgi:hypothetical protein
VTCDQKDLFVRPICYVCNMSLLAGITIGTNHAHSQQIEPTDRSHMLRSSPD